MALEIDSIVDGKITGITNFGAFVTTEDGSSGLVHISEVSNVYVKDIKEHLVQGQQVKVKVIGVDKTGRFNFSIKKAIKPVAVAKKPVTEKTFEEKLKQFIQDSENKMCDINRQNNRKSGNGKRSGRK